jgi:hypothetical protein
MCTDGRAQSFPDSSCIGRCYVLLESNTNRVNGWLLLKVALLVPKIESVFEDNNSSLSSISGFIVK